MNVTLAVLADYANVTGDGKLNILGIFDRMNVASLPAVHPQMNLVLRIEAHSAELDRSHPVEIRLHDPDGQTIFEVKGEILPQGAPGQTISTNQILRLNNLQLSKTGDYTFIVFVNNDLKAEIPLLVEFGALDGPPMPPTVGPLH